MKDEFIVLKGCRENNLKNISLKIPKRKITVFTGVSGSGKSSIVFETIGKEASRQLNETFSAFVRKFLTNYGEVKADSIENLLTPILIDQKRLGGNSRSTLGTISDINPLLRTLFSRIGTPYVGPPHHFSFNDINGMCPECEGLGRKMEANLDAILDQSKSLNEGAILLPNFNVGSWYWKIFAESGFFDNDKKICDYSKEELEKFLYGSPEKLQADESTGMRFTYEGLIVKFNRLYFKKDGEQSEAAKKKLDNLLKESDCPLCHGSRLKQDSLNCRIQGLNIAEMTELQIDELLGIIDDIKEEGIRPVINSLKEKLKNIVDIGLGYLTLDRESSSLSGGEAQRIKMVRYLNSSLTDLMYIFDEPSIGLHPRDVYRLNNLLMKLRDKGNTVIIVEHDPDVIKIADHIVDVGPFAGKGGGEIMFEGSFVELLKSDTLTGKALNKKLSLKEQVRKPNGWLEIKNANLHNLKNVSVKIPEGVLTVVTGVAGSGKSSLMKGEFLKQHPEVVLIDQSPVFATSRSNLATYGGMMDEIRKVFAKENKVSASLFSYNSEGACESCKGTGFIETEIAFMENTKVECEECQGKRFKKAVLEYKVKEKSILDILEMTVSEAISFFEEKKIKVRLVGLEEMGIGYLTLGQPLDTLSGGECQRLKLANELHKKSNVYVMDEPSTGLHMSDIENFTEIIQNLIENGNTVVIIEHNVDIMKQADWIIDIGPEGGIKGGEVIFEGPPMEITKCERSLTGKYI